MLGIPLAPRRSHRSIVTFAKVLFQGLLVLCLCLRSGYASVSGTGQITAVRSGVYPEFTRVVFDLDREIPYSVSRTEEGAIEVVFKPSALAPTFHMSKVRSALVKEVTVHESGGDAVTGRILAEGDATEFRHMLLEDPPRVALDVMAVKHKEEQKSAEGSREPDKAASPAPPVMGPPIKEESIESASGVSEGEVPDAERLLTEAESFFESARYEEAEDRFESYLAYFPEGPQARAVLRKMGDCSFRAGRFDDAVSYYERALRGEGDLSRWSPKTLWNMGLAFLEKKQAARARSAFFALLNIFAQEVPREEVVEKIVAAYRSEGREEEAQKVVANWGGTHAFEKQDAANVGRNKFGRAPKIDASVEGDSVPEEERSVFEDALKHYRGKDYRNALAKLSFFLGKYPDSSLAPIASYRLGDCYYALAEVSPQYQAAVDTYQSAILQYPQSPLASWGLFQLANAYRHMEFYFEANENYARLLKDFPECASAGEARFFMAEAFFESGDFQKAYRGWSELLRRDPESAHAKEMLFGMGDCLAHLKRYREASETYHKTLERWPDLAELSPTTLFNMGRVHLNLGAYTEARRALFLAFNLFPEDEIGQHVMLMIGDAYFLEGQTGKALKTYSQVQPIYPATEGALLSRLKMADIGVKQPGFYNFDQYLDPLHVYQEVIEKYPTSELVEGALYKKGFALSEQGKFLEALDSLRYLIAYYPESDVTRRAGEAMHGILVKLLDAYYTEKQYGLVVETYYRESEHLRGELPASTLVQLGDSFCHLGLPDEALRLYQEARKRGDCPKDHLLFGEGRALSVKGNLPEAREKFHGLIASFPDSPPSCEAKHLLGDVSFQEADFAEAASLYESALLCSAGHDREVKSLLFLGHSHVRRGRVNLALEAYERCLEAIDSISDEPHPLRLECQLSVADSLVRLKRYSEATSHYQAALDSDPEPEDRNWAFYQIASCFHHMGREKEATLYLDQLGKQEDLEPLWNSLGKQRAQGFEWEKRYAERLSSL